MPGTFRDGIREGRAPRRIVLPNACQPRTGEIRKFAAFFDFREQGAGQERAARCGSRVGHSAAFRAGAVWQRRLAGNTMSWLQRQSQGCRCAGSLLGPKNVKWTSEESTDISTSSASTASLASVFRLTLQLSHHILNGRRTRIGSDVSTPTENCLDTYLRNLAGLRRLPGEDREREQVAFRGVHLVGFGLIADSLDSCLQQQRTHHRRHRRHRRRPPPRREIPRPRRGSIVRCATSPEPPGSVVLEEMRPILVCPDKHLGTPRSRRLSQLVMT